MRPKEQDQRLQPASICSRFWASAFHRSGLWVAHQVRCVCRLMLHSEPEKAHLPCSLRCCCLRAVSAYQLQSAVCAEVVIDAARAKPDTRARNATDLIIGRLPAELRMHGNRAAHAHYKLTPLWIV